MYYNLIKFSPYIFLFVKFLSFNLVKILPLIDDTIYIYFHIEH